MKIVIGHIDCGNLGTIIDCYSSRIFCPFCKERTISLREIKEVTPQELYNLIDSFKYVIKTIKEK